MRAGTELVAVVENHLPDPTTVHWHGIALPFDMDGVPGVTQDPIEPGASFTYRFTPTTPGTYFLHPHVGVQLDRGLYAPLIVDDPHDPGDYDDEWIVVLDDWTDGVGPSPDQILAGLLGNGGRRRHGHRTCRAWRCRRARQTLDRRRPPASRRPATVHGVELAARGQRRATSAIRCTS